MRHALRMLGVRRRHAESGGHRGTGRSSGHAKAANHKPSQSHANASRTNHRTDNELRDPITTLDADWLLTQVDQDDRHFTAIV